MSIPHICAPETSSRSSRASARSAMPIAIKMIAAPAPVAAPSRSPNSHAASSAAMRGSKSVIVETNVALSTRTAALSAVCPNSCESSAIARMPPHARASPACGRWSCTATAPAASNIAAYEYVRDVTASVSYRASTPRTTIKYAANATPAGERERDAERRVRTVGCADDDRDAGQRRDDAERGERVDAAAPDDGIRFGPYGRRADEQRRDRDRREVERRDPRREVDGEQRAGDGEPPLGPRVDRSQPSAHRGEDDERQRGDAQARRGHRERAARVQREPREHRRRPDRKLRQRGQKQRPVLHAAQP